MLRALDVFADYHAYYRAAANLRAGADIYAEGKLLVARDSFDFWTQTDGQYVYPPALAVALLPLTLLDIGKGGAVWLLTLTLATLALPWLIARLLGYPVGLSSFLTLAFPTWTLLPLILGARYGLVAAPFVALLALTLAIYLALTLGNPTTPVPTTPAAASPSLAPTRRERLLALLPLAAPLIVLVAFAFLILALGWRTGQIDAYLLKLALPGLVGTALLPWLRRAPLNLRPPTLADLDALLPLAIPILGATPLLLGLRFGQADILLLLLTTLALLAHLRRRDLLAGVALGAAAAVKPTLALYGLYYLRKRAWSTLVAAALTGATLGLAPFLLLGRVAFADWFAISRYFSGDHYPAYPSNQSLRGLLLRAFVGGPGYAPLLTSHLLAQTLWLLAVAAALTLWWRTISPQRQPARRVASEYALTAALILFAAPLSEDIHYVALLLPLALLADHLAHPPTTPGHHPFSTHAILPTLALLICLLPLPDLLTPLTTLSLPLHLLASAPYLYALLLTTAALRTLPIPP